MPPVPYRAGLWDALLSTQAEEEGNKNDSLRQQSLLLLRAPHPPPPRSLGRTEKQCCPDAPCPRTGAQELARMGDPLMTLLASSPSKKRTTATTATGSPKADTIVKVRVPLRRGKTAPRWPPPSTLPIMLGPFHIRPGGSCNTLSISHAQHNPQQHSLHRSAASTEVPWRDFSLEAAAA